MIILIMGLVIIIVILLAYIFYMKKEMMNISKQLDDYNNLKTEKKIDVNLINKEIELLASSINKHIEVANRLRINEVKSKEELKDMISNISHDLRTPLTSIIGYIQMLNTRENGDFKNLEYLKKVEKRAKDLQVMLEDFFTLSVIDNSDYDMKLEGVNINEVVFETVISFYEQLEENGVEPKIELEEDLEVLGDTSAITRVVENLMINVIKHSGGEFSIKLKKDESKVKLIFMNYVKEEVNTDKIFSKFYKGNDRSRSGKNTGLGLSIVKTLMEMMNGKVSAKCENGKLFITCEWIAL
ncbi:MAG: sensor histidine kinase [Clostridium sp.]|uniref:sensor histidine kinase n=1 Tax=Clostridium sp. TaxID=1506 RepID=UPI003F3DBFF8